MTKNLCILPWISLETTPIGTARPCCLIEDRDVIKDSHGNHMTLDNNTLINIFNSQYMQDLRKQFRNGERPSICSKCWAEEDSGRKSKRLNSLHKFNDEFQSIDFSKDEVDKILFLDLKLGNICNLKCRICGSWSSSKWAGEEIDYLKLEGYSKEDVKKHTAYEMLKKGHWPRKSPKFWESLKALLPDIQYFEFTGGEPFLIEEHFDLLNFAAKNNYSKNISVHYNTNGTVYPEQAISLWRKFKNVEIAFSIDDIEKRFEYQRFGAKWDQVTENIEKFNKLRQSNKNIQTQLCFTINILNILYIEQLLKWAIKQNFNSIHWNMLHGPEELCIGSLPPEQKSQVIEKLNKMNVRGYEKHIQDTIRFIQNGKSLSLIDICERLRRTDQYRNQNLRDHHPELAEILEYG